MIATGGDLACLYTNPALLTQMHGTNLKLEMNWGTHTIKYRREPFQNAITNDNPGDPLPMIALSSDFGLEDFVFAFGAYGPNGIGAYYPKDSTARYTAVDIVTIAANIEVAAAWQPLSWFSIGVGGFLISFIKDDQYAYSLLHDQDVRYDVIADFEANSWDTFNWTAGLWFKPWKHLELGFSFIPKVKANLYGEINAELPPLYAALVGRKTYTDEIVLSVWLADIIRAGVHVIFTDWIDMEVAAVYSTWSIQDQFTVDFKSEELIEDFIVPRDAKDTWNFRVGGDLKLLPWWTVRTGYQFDQTSLTKERISPGGVEADRHHVAGGMSFYAWGMDVDFSYQHVFQPYLKVTNPDTSGGLGDGRGEYWSSFDMFSIAVNWNFGDFYRALKKEPPRFRKKGSLF